MIAARDHDVAFIVMMAGSGVPGDRVIAAQAGLIAEAAGQSHEQAMKIEARQREILDLVKNTTDEASLQKLCAINSLGKYQRRKLVPQSGSLHHRGIGTSSPMILLWLCAR